MRTVVVESLGVAAQRVVEIARRREIPAPLEQTCRRSHLLGRTEQQVDQGRMKVVAHHQLGCRCQQVDVLLGQVVGEIESAFRKFEQRQKVQPPGVGLCPPETHQADVGIEHQAIITAPAIGHHEERRIDLALHKQPGGIILIEAEQPAVVCVHAVQPQKLARQHFGATSVDAHGDALAAQIAQMPHV